MNGVGQLHKRSTVPARTRFGPSGVARAVFISEPIHSQGAYLLSFHHSLCRVKETAICFVKFIRFFACLYNSVLASSAIVMQEVYYLQALMKRSVIYEDYSSKRFCAG